ncbi:TPR repeat-containing protein RHE_CH03534.1 [Durusdinium trenchii]|uniref:TPR repeat-containing protein RHE_CH03534.1 n=1 Tax=Durusdinium trenchii TaxID=1381693 RepID=A0ABP0LD98_9DINO
MGPNTPTLDPGRIPLGRDRGTGREVALARHSVAGCGKSAVVALLTGIISSRRPHWARLEAVARLRRPARSARAMHDPLRKAEFTTCWVFFFSNAPSPDPLSPFRLASPPAPVLEAENALHAVLLSTDSGGELQGAIEDALRCCWEDSGDSKVNAEMSLGVRLMDEGELEQAVDVFTRVIARAPSFAEAWHKRSIAHFAQQKYREAVEDCEEALALRPLHYWCLTGMGTCHYELGEKQKAKDCWKAALQVCPSMPGAQAKLEEAEVNEKMDLQLGPRMDWLISSFQDGDPQLQCLGHALRCAPHPDGPGEVPERVGLLLPALVAAGRQAAREKRGTLLPA